MTYHVQFLLLVLAGWVNRQQQDVIDYLREENRQDGDVLDIFVHLAGGLQQTS